mmetsp:Transcript_8719/g.12892  ORF Transcript_8719/g.12892 Transcript_8719/m.12892 type:complete len:868 (+) Transcript_8719:30-2633(+)
MKHKKRKRSQKTTLFSFWKEDPLANKKPKKKKRKQTVEIINLCDDESDASSSPMVDHQDDNQNNKMEDSKEGENKLFHVENFDIVLEKGITKEKHLLLEAELNWIKVFRSLKLSEQSLFIRLFNRKTKWFWASTTLSARYEEIKNHRELIKSLQGLLDHQFIEKFDILKLAMKDYESKQQAMKNQSLNSMEDTIEFIQESDINELKQTIMGELLSTIPVANLKKIYMNFLKGREKRSVNRKNDLIEAILGSTNPNQLKISSFFKSTSSKSVNDSLYNSIYGQLKGFMSAKYAFRLEPHALALFRFLHRLYYLQGSQQNQTLMVLTNMSIFKFVPYVVSKTSIFHSREKLQAYDAVMLLYEHFVEKTMGKSNAELFAIQEEVVSICKYAFNSLSQLKKDESYSNYFQSKYSDHYVLMKLLHHGCSIMERYKEYEKVVSYYQYMIEQKESPLWFNKMGKWYHRLALDLSQYLNKTDEAIEYLENALNYEPLSCPSRVLLEKYYYKLTRLEESPLYYFLNEIKKAKVIEITGTRATSALPHMHQGKNLYLNDYYQCDEASIKQFDMEHSNDKIPDPLELPAAADDDDEEEDSIMEDSQLFERSMIITEKNLVEEEAPIPLEQKELIFVEEVALLYYKYKRQYPIGYHCEGSIFRYICNLLFWDIIYDNDVECVFQSAYQTAPLDFRDGQLFYYNRKKRCDQRIQFIKTRLLSDLDFNLEAYKESIKVAYESLENVDASPNESLSYATLFECQIDDPLLELLYYRYHEVLSMDGLHSVLNRHALKLYDANCLLAFIPCISPNVLAQICQVFIKDARENAGFPDVIVYNIENKTALFSEVKSKDRLSHKQEFWIDLLINAGATVELCHVNQI